MCVYRSETGERKKREWVSMCVYRSATGERGKESGWMCVNMGRGRGLLSRRVLMCVCVYERVRVRMYVCVRERARVCV